MLLLLLCLVLRRVWQTTRPVLRVACRPCRRLRLPSHLYPQPYAAVSGLCLRGSSAIGGDGAPASWANLLSLKPALKTAQMQSMTTWKLLRTSSVDCTRVVHRIPRPHFLSADDASVLLRQLFRGGVGVTVHLLDRPAVAQQGAQPLQEIPRGHEKVSDNVYWQPIEHNEHEKERDIDAKLDHV